MGRTFNQFQRLCPPSTHSLSSVENYESTYSSINSLDTNGDDDALEEFPHNVDLITDDDKDDLICGINLNADNYGLCKTKAAHAAVLGKIDATKIKKTSTAMKAPHLDTKVLNLKLDDVAKPVDLVVSTILTDSWPKKQDNCYAITKFSTNWKMTTYESAYHYRSS